MLLTVLGAPGGCLWAEGHASDLSGACAWAACHAADLSGACRELVFGKNWKELERILDRFRTKKASGSCSLKLIN